MFVRNNHSRAHLKGKSSNAFSPNDISFLSTAAAAPKYVGQSSKLFYKWAAITFSILFLLFYFFDELRIGDPSITGNDYAYPASSIVVFQTAPSDSSSSPSHQDAHYISKIVSTDQILYRAFSVPEQQQFLHTYGTQCYAPTTSIPTSHSPNILFDRFVNLHSSETKNKALATELWKYCVLYIHGGAFIDEDTVPLLVLDNLLSKHREVKNNVAVLAQDENIHGGFVFFGEKHSSVTKRMLSYLVGVKDDIAITQPNFISKHLYYLIQNDVEKEDQVQDTLSIGLNNNGRWNLLELNCQPIQQNVPKHEKYQEILAKVGSPLPQNYCPIFNGYCCSIFDTTATFDENSENNKGQLLFNTRHPLPQMHFHFLKNIDDIQLPYAFQKKTHFESNGYTDNFPTFIGKEKSNMQDPLPKADPHIATIREVLYSRPKDEHYVPTQRMYDFLFENDCLPSDKNCHKCLRSYNSKKGSCANCFKYCQCYCQALCKYRPPEKFVSKDYWIRLPHFRKNPDRLIPRILHQTFYETITPEKYPNMSRLIESWKNSGWEYNFYDDEAAAAFLSTHFPDEVRQAYDALIPGAFKADLFRYCVLLIRGGLYVDMDVLLESNLDKSIPSDIGFLVPIDEPGTKVNQRMCLWNGLIAVTPGHPIIAKAVERAVNNIRNRFTGVDYDDMFCPSPVLSISHMVDMLFTAGPCLLGTAFNSVLGRHMQQPMVTGESDVWKVPMKKYDQNSFTPDEEKTYFDDPRLFMPGRTVILKQEKEDMGAHRFTLEETNIIVAATDFPNYEDRPNFKSKHYSKTCVKAGIYGVEKLYIDNQQADEKIRIFIEGM